MIHKNPPYNMNCKWITLKLLGHLLVAWFSLRYLGNHLPIIMEQWLYLPVLDIGLIWTNVILAGLSLIGLYNAIINVFNYLASFAFVQYEWMIDGRYPRPISFKN